MKMIVIVADINDADYVTNVKEITDIQLEVITPVINAIKNFKPYGDGYMKHTHNYPTGENVREDLGEKSGFKYYNDKGISVIAMNLFEDFLPNSEHGIHTIESIKILNVTEDIKLL